MNTLTRNMSNSRRRQHGAVAIIVGFSIFVLVGMLGFVLDLGHLYIAKTELQNAADAAALSGAKELNGTTNGIILATEMAGETAAKNKYFGAIGHQEVEISDAENGQDIMFADNPYASEEDWKTISEAKSSPANLYFIRINTTNRNIPTWFMHILYNWLRKDNSKMTTPSTYGLAVAGLEIAEVMPLGICAIDPEETTEDADGGYYGFDKGIAYDLPELNKLYPGLGSGTLLWLHPTAKTQDECNTYKFTSADAFQPFVCQGKSALTGANVYANTGISTGPMQDAINTRFGTKKSDYSDKDLPAESCPPDANVMEFSESKSSTFFDGWLKDTDPSLQSTILSGTEAPLNSNPTDSVIGSYKRPQIASYVAMLASGIASSPYAQGLDTSSKYHEEPYKGEGSTPAEGRRLLNVVILQCPPIDTGKGGLCATFPVLSYGTFFMPVKADFPKSLPLEFVGKYNISAQPGVVKLYQ